MVVEMPLRNKSSPECLTKQFKRFDNGEKLIPNPSKNVLILPLQPPNSKLKRCLELTVMGASAC